MSRDRVLALLKLYFSEAKEAELQRIVDRIVEIERTLSRDAA